MKFEPPVVRARLVKAVRAAYGLPAASLEFIPVGYAAACYAVDCTPAAGGARYFLKLWPDTRSNRATERQRDAMLRLVQALHERTSVRVAPPLLTRDGALRADFEGAAFALFPFIEGHAPAWDGTSWPAALVDRYAATLAALHASTAVLVESHGSMLPREDFEAPWEPELRAALSSLDNIDARARPGLRGLQALLLPRRHEVLAQLARLAGLRPVVRDLDSPYVLCHTDSGGYNLIVGASGELTVLDWDDARLAPPEYDLHEICRLGPAGVVRFIATYRAAGGAGPLQLAQFEFALLRRHVEDMAVRIFEMLDRELSPEEDDDCLADIEEWGVGEWRALETMLDELRVALDG